jgi:ABC-type uncharacterized transport system substrate-binding protein
MEKVKTEVMSLSSQSQIFSSLAMKMVSAFPDLDNYKNEWPLDNIIIALLKYSLSQNKGHLIKKKMEAVQDMVVSTMVTKKQKRATKRQILFTAGLLLASPHNP